MAELQQRKSDDLPFWAAAVSEQGGSLAGFLGFGLFVSWTWLGLYQGYPSFTDGSVDVVSAVTLLFSFGIACLGLCFPDCVFMRLLRPSLPMSCAAVASLGCLLAMLVAAIGAPRAALWACIGLVGAGGGVLLVCFGLLFSQMRPVAALLGYCLSFVATLFAFFCVNVTGAPWGAVVFSALPLVAAACLMPSFRGVAQDGEQAIAAKPRWAVGFVRMVAAFAVFAFCASFTQSFEPPKDFALSVDQGVVEFGVVMAAAFLVVVRNRRTMGTFRVLKVAYQAAVILLVFKFVLQPIADEDTYFAALNVLTFFLLFMVFWLLASYVGYVGDVRASKVFALAFGVAAVCLAIGWVAGKHVYGVFGHDRLYFSIATGCMVAVFSAFGFSVRDFPRLSYSGKGIERMAAREAARASVADEESKESPVVVTQETVLASLVESHQLSVRESEVLGLIVQGMTAESVAERLVISPHTVRAHIRNIYSKLGVGSRGELFALMFQREKELADEVEAKRLEL